MLKGIVAHDEDLCIGWDNKMLWHYKEDLQRLKALTMNKTCIVGSKTYDWLKQYRPNADHLPPYTKETYILHRDNKDWILKNTEHNVARVLWGAMAFKELLPYIDELYVTLVPGHHNGDAYMPEYRDKFELVEEEKSGELTYQIYKKI